MYSVPNTTLTPPPTPRTDLGDEDPGERARADDRLPVPQGVLLAHERLEPGGAAQARGGAGS